MHENADHDCRDTPSLGVPELEAREFRAFLAFAAKRDDTGPMSLRRWLELAEAWRIATALRSTGGNRSAAARELGIGRRTLYAKMEKLGIRPTWTV